MRVFFSCIVGLSCFFAPRQARSEAPPRFELVDGDRIVLVGDTLIERDQRYGYLETLLSIMNPDKSLVFRNLGWSGDTVGGISRSGFDPPAAGFEQLRQQILAVKPTVVVLGYGMADSFAGEAGLAAFEQGMNRLLDLIATTKARVVLLSPVAHANLGPPLPDPTDHNRDLAHYRDVIERIAEERSAGFIDLYRLFDMKNGGLRLPVPGVQDFLRDLMGTDNGIHLNENGYWDLALYVSKLLDQDREAKVHSLVLGSDGTIKSQDRTEASRVEKTPDGLRFEMTASVLPFRSPSCRLTDLGTLFPRRLAVHDLAPGTYELKIDGKSVATENSYGWKEGVFVRSGPEPEQADALRAAINRKNDLFFYRWRPQNITYLTGFRKHEQGNNAIEIPRFDPLVAEQEKLIARLKKPVSHRYELSRVAKELGR